jgi:hypothetical protein
MLGTFALSTGYYGKYYLKAQKVRMLIKQEFDRAFEKYDALAARYIENFKLFSSGCPEEVCSAGPKTCCVRPRPYSRN